MPLTPQNTDPNVGVLVPVITKPGQPSHQADAVWGGIVGALSNQTDLWTALDAKAERGSLAPVATSGDYADLSGKPALGTAAAQSTSAFATAAQGAKADTALQGGAGLSAIDSAAATKLAGIAPGATANDTDAALKDRANHTGQQALSTLSQSGATPGQVIKWDGTKWIPANESGGGGGGTWGSITGTLSSQTDLQNALDGKSDKGHDHDGVYVKPASLAAVATSGDYDDLLNKPRRAWRELIVADGVTPPTFLLNEAGTDYLYSEFLYE